VSFAYSVLAGLVAPLMTLFVATIATNKIEAMTWQKLFNLPLFLPIAAFFMAAPVSLLFAIFPTYWMYQGFSALIEGRPSSGFLLAGFVYSLVLIGLMVRRFTRSHFV
jgi:fluoroquinolone transport system permease protein